MNIIDGIIPEFNHEMEVTRRELDRVREEDFAFKPHEKSFSLQQLASHMVDIPGWTADTLNKDEMVMEPGQYKPFQASNKAELVKKFDENVAAAQNALQGKTNEQMMATWKMKIGGKEVMSLPKIAVLRGFIISHMIHDRAQLGVYLRLRNVPVPQCYGPTADEPEMRPM
jgi:uncharacterized damage-inducible protein DinB